VAMWYMYSHSAHELDSRLDISAYLTDTSEPNSSGHCVHSCFVFLRGQPCPPTPARDITKIMLCK